MLYYLFIELEKYDLPVSGQLKPARNGHFLKPKTSHPV